MTKPYDLRTPTPTQQDLSAEHEAQKAPSQESLKDTQKRLEKRMADTYAEYVRACNLLNQFEDVFKEFL